MGWETRKGKGRYFTISKRVGGRVTRQYYGCKELAQIADFVQQEARAARKANREAVRQAQGTFAGAQALQQPLKRSASALLYKLLRRAGYHQHGNT